MVGLDSRLFAGKLLVMVRSFMAGLFVMMLAAGCSQSTSIEVVVESSLSVPEDIDALRISGQTDTGGTFARSDALVTSFPHSLVIVREDSSLAKQVLITVEGISNRRSVIRRVAKAEFFTDKSLKTRVRLSESCLNVQCGGQEDCQDGACVAIENPLPDGGVDAGMDAGASLTDAPVDSGVDSSEGLDAWKEDGGSEDAGMTQPDCLSIDNETCNGLDDDGDGWVDECVPCLGTLLLSELTPRGPSGDALDEFVEIYNPTALPIRLDGLQLEYRSATGSHFASRFVVPSSGIVLPPGAFFLVASTNYSMSVPPDASNAWTTGFSDGGGHVRIVHSAAEMQVSEGELDRLGWGTAASPECALSSGSACPAPVSLQNAGASFERRALATSTAASMVSGGSHHRKGNAYDSDQNVDDWIVRPQCEPQNRLSAAEPASN